MVFIYSGPGSSTGPGSSSGPASGRFVNNSIVILAVCQLSTTYITNFGNGQDGDLLRRVSSIASQQLYTQ